MPAKRKDAPTPATRENSICRATKTYRDEGRPIDSTARCAKLTDHIGKHRSISGKEW